MKQLSIQSIALTTAFIACSPFLLVSCSEKKPAGSDKPKTKVKTVKGTELEMFKDDKKKVEKTEKTPAKPVSKPESKPETE